MRKFLVVVTLIPALGLIGCDDDMYYPDGLPAATQQVSQSDDKIQKPLVVTVDLSDRTLQVRRGDDVLLSTTVSIGRPESPTPVGEFITDQKRYRPAQRTASGRIIPGGDPSNPLGNYWIRFQNRDDSNGYNPDPGFHVETNPSEIGSENSLGCVKMLEPVMAQFFELVPEGTKVIIQD